MTRAPVRTIYGEVRRHIPTEVLNERGAVVKGAVERLSAFLPATGKDLVDEFLVRVALAIRQGSGKSPQDPDFIAARADLDAVAAETKKLTDRYLREKAEAEEQRELEAQTERDDEFLSRPVKEKLVELFGDFVVAGSPHQLKQAAMAIFQELDATKDVTNLKLRAEQTKDLRARAAELKETFTQQFILEDGVKECIDIIGKNKGGTELVELIKSQLEECKKGDFQAGAMQQLETMKNRAKVQAKLVIACNSKLRNVPETQQKFLEALRKNPSEEQLNGLMLELKTIEDAGADRARVRVKEVIGKQEEDVKALDLGSRIALLDDLRYADESTDNAKKMKHTALALVYISTKEMQPEFLAKDDEMRKEVLNDLAANKTVLDLRKNWAIKTPKERAEGLKEIATLQCAQMAKALGIDVAKMPVPKIILASDPDSGIKPDKLKNMAGGFSPTEGNIYIKDEHGSKADTDCNYVLNTILHENTHNYQLKLVEMLESGELKKDTELGKALYDQARLFQQNIGPGPGYVGEPPGYFEQPTEVHAHLAGDTAEEFFKQQDLQEAKAVIEKLKNWAETNSKDDKKIAEWCQAIETAASSGKSAALMGEVNYYEKKFEEYCEELAKKPVVTGDIEDVQKQLKGLMPQFTEISQVVVDTNLLDRIQTWKRLAWKDFLDEDVEPDYGEAETYLEVGRKLIEEANLIVANKEKANKEEANKENT